LAEGFQRRRLKVNGRQTTDAKWWQKLTLPLAKWAKKSILSTYYIFFKIISRNTNFFFT
jgi:hypothetical protein